MSASEDPPVSGVVMAMRKAELRAALLGETIEPLRFGRYVVLGTVGRGGMGTVLEAFDRSLDRRVAVKVLHHDVAKEQGRRLVREAQALARLSHPNVVQVYEVGEVQGRTFVAMELVTGKDLRAWSSTSPPPTWKEHVAVYLQAGAGLAAAHAKGIVHRDFKPSNAIIDEDGRVRVLDFGLARRITGGGSEDGEAESEAAPVPNGLREDHEGAEPLTRSSTIIGTPAYMAPEQMRGEEVDARSDQFSFCVSLYEAIVGQRPFEGTSIQALLLSMTSARSRPSPSSTKIPARLQPIVTRGMAFEPAERWPSMDALLDELRRAIAPRRSGLVLALPLAGVLAVLGVGVGYYAADAPREQEPPCRSSAERLAGVWDDARRDEVEAAVVGTELSYAADTWERVRPQLDDYAERWVAKHQEVCEATRVGGDQTEEAMTLRMGCLSSRRLELQATVDVLANADETRVRNAVELVEGLPGLERCDDVEALRAEVAPPEDPEVAKAVEQAREQLAEAKALFAAGAHARSEEVSRAVVQRAETLGYGPLLAEALWHRGIAQRGAGEYDLAEEDLEQAHLLAIEHDHDEVALATASSLTLLVGERLARYEQGHQWGELAMAMAKRPGMGEQAQANALVNIGAVLKTRGERQSALDHYRRSLAIKERLGPRHTDVAMVLNNIGVLLDEQGELDRALEHYQRALDIRVHALGPRHPLVAMSSSNIGVALALRGEHDQALEHFERALSIHEATLGPRHPRVAISLNNLGMLLAMRGDHERARNHYQRALSICEESLDPQHPSIAQILVGLADTTLALEEPLHARDLAERAISIIEAQPSPDALVLAEARFVLARASWQDPGQRSLARGLAEQARAVFAEQPEVAAELLARTESWLAEHAVPRGSPPSSTGRNDVGTGP